MENNEVFNSTLNQISRALCWVDGSLSDNELEAGCQLGRLLVPEFDEGLFRFTITTPPDSDEKLDNASLIGALKFAQRLLSEEQITTIFTFATTLIMADGEVTSEEKELVDQIGNALGFDTLGDIYSDEERLKQVKKAFEKKLLSADDTFLGSEAKMGLLVAVRKLNLHAGAQDILSYYKASVDFLKRGILYQLITMDELQDDAKRVYAADINLVEKSTIRDKLKKINFVTVSVRLEQPSFDVLSASVMSKDVAGFFSHLTLIFKMHKFIALQNFFLGKELKPLKKHKNIAYKNLMDILRSDFGWEENSFSNNCGKIDLVDGHSGLKPHSGNFIKRIFKRVVGSEISLDKMLVPEETYVKFTPEALVSILHSRDANFWLTYFKTEALYLGNRDNEKVDLLGVPLNEDRGPDGESILNKDLLFLGFSPSSRGTQMCLQNVENGEVWKMPSIVFYACGAVQLAR